MSPIISDFQEMTKSELVFFYFFIYFQANSTLTVQILYSGILATGSSAAIVSSLAGDSGK
jgi:hypothetical protein